MNARFDTILISYKHMYSLVTSPIEIILSLPSTWPQVHSMVSVSSFLLMTMILNSKLSRGGKPTSASGFSNAEWAMTEFDVSHISRSNYVF